MTPLPPIDTPDPLDADERAMAARLAALGADGPTAALDARILAAARAATRQRPRRRAGRWPTAVGALATLVVAVGLAWQLKPLIDMPPPLRAPARPAVSTDVEILARAERVPSTAAPEAAGVPTDSAATSSAPAAATAATSRPQPSARASAPPRAARAQPPVAAAAPAPLPPGEFMHEAVGDASAASAAAAPPPHEAQASARNLPASPSAPGPDPPVSGIARIKRPVAHDARLAPADWLTRIRERRDAGDLAGARASLRRFMREYPHHRVPDDLRALRRAPR